MDRSKMTSNYNLIEIETMHASRPGRLKRLDLIMLMFIIFIMMEYIT